MSRYIKSILPFVSKKRYKEEITVWEEAAKHCINDEHQLIEEILETVAVHEDNDFGFFSLSQSILQIIHKRLGEKDD